MGDGSDTIADFNTGNSGTLDDGDSTNNDYINLSAYYDHISELYADQADDGILNQSNATDTRGNTVDYSDNSEFSDGEGITFTGASADESSFTEENTGVVCFAAGTLIDTPTGSVPVEKLRAGERVCTYAGPPEPLIWTGYTELALTAGTRDPRRTPVRIKPPPGSNQRALLVSPQHCMLMSLPDGQTAFVRARHLAEETRLASFACGRSKVRYFHLCFSKHTIVISQGRPSESFYPGPWAMQMMPAIARARLIEAMPILAHDTAVAKYGARAAILLTRQELRDFARSDAFSFASPVPLLCARDLAMKQES